MDPALQELLLTEDLEHDILETIIKLQPGQEAPPAVEVVTRFGDIATCRIKREDVRSVYEKDVIISMKAPRSISIEPPPLPEVNTILETETTTSYKRRPNSVFTGKGVVVGIIDWGFDFAHQNFISPSGGSRFLAIWDQTIVKHKSTAKYGYGKAYYRKDINQALKTDDPYKTLGYHPSKSEGGNGGAHGTHVLDIAAGNGRNGMMGVAPQADIIAVHLANRNTEGLKSLGDSVRILEAIDFIHRTAGDRPLVINMSVGKHGGSHTGTSLVEQGMDVFLKQNSNRCIVQSTGNYFLAKTHAAGQLLPNESTNLQWKVDQNDTTLNELEIWYPGIDRMKLILQTPDGLSRFESTLDQKVKIIVNNELVGNIYHRAYEPNTGMHHIDIFMYTNAPTGNWKVKLFGEQIRNGQYHSWIERDGGCSSCQSRFDVAETVKTATTGTICNGQYTIAVGAYDPHVSEFKMASFSSSGPTLNCRPKPEILAPGIRIEAARSAAINEPPINHSSTSKSGTSMAAPHITGTVALLYEAFAEKTDIITLRKRLLDVKFLTPIKDNEKQRTGQGWLDVERLLEQFNPSTNNLKQEIRLKEETDIINTKTMPHGYLLHEDCLECQHVFIPLVEKAIKAKSKSQSVIQHLIETLNNEHFPLKDYHFFDHYDHIYARYPELRNYLEIIATPQGYLEHGPRDADILITRPFGEGAISFTKVIDETKQNFPFEKMANNQMLIRLHTKGYDQDSAENTNFTIQVRNRLKPTEVIADCGVTITGLNTQINGITNRYGNFIFDIDSLSDGVYQVNVLPTHNSNAAIGPATSQLNPLPDRIFRSFTTTIEIQNKRITSSSIFITPKNRNRISVSLQPVWMRSPNQRNRPAGTTVDTIVIHHTAGPRIGPAINTFLNTSEGVSAHYLIDTDGQILKMVDDNARASHAGSSYWAGKFGLNDFSIGIEIVHRDGFYPEVQYQALINLLIRLRAAFPAILPNNIVGHSDIAYSQTPRRLGRKSGDPGSTFDWARLAAAGLSRSINARVINLQRIYGGLFATYPDIQLIIGDNDNNQKYGGKVRQNSINTVIYELQQDLRSIGYLCPLNGFYNQPTARAVSVFQERFFSGSLQNSNIRRGKTAVDTALRIKQVL